MLKKYQRKQLRNFLLWRSFGWLRDWKQKPTRFISYIKNKLSENSVNDFFYQCVCVYCTYTKIKWCVVMQENRIFVIFILSYTIWNTTVAPNKKISSQISHNFNFVPSIFRFSFKNLVSLPTCVYCETSANGNISPFHPRDLLWPWILMEFEMSLKVEKDIS